jgi:autophagy-related protein 17
MEDLVKHFVAAKRALNTQTLLYHANDIVTSARELLEENAILAAKNASVRNIIVEQTDALEAVRRGMHLVETEVQTDFKVAIPTYSFHKPQSI